MRPPIPPTILADRLAFARRSRERAAEYARLIIDSDIDAFDTQAADLRANRYKAACLEVEAWDTYLAMTEAAHDNAVLAEMDYRPSLFTDGAA